MQHVEIANDRQNHINAHNKCELNIPKKAEIARLDKMVICCLQEMLFRFNDMNRLKEDIPYKQ